METEVVQYKKQLEAEGFPFIYEWEDAPNTTYKEHSHRGRVCLYILEGEVTFFGGITLTARQGQRVDVPINILHSAKVGPMGCKYLVGEDIEGDA